MNKTTYKKKEVILKTIIPVMCTLLLAGLYIWYARISPDPAGKEFVPDSVASHGQYIPASMQYIQADAANAGNYKVYKHDGTTLLGAFSGFFPSVTPGTSPCTGWGYFDPVNGGLKTFGQYDCDAAAAATFYYSGSDCTGLIRKVSACQGLMTDGVLFSYTTAPSGGNCANNASSYATNSYRQNGICTNSADSEQRYLSTSGSYTPACGGNGACVIK